MGSLLQFTENGIYCPQGDFYIDPWKRVSRAVITHAHSDHARWGMGAYLSHPLSEPIMRLRLGQDIALETAAYGEEKWVNGVQISLHPAGHIPGSAQVRVEYKGEVWVVSGDYKTENDGISTPFEPVRCHTFISESTFGLPIYAWPAQQEIMNEVGSWWAKNAEAGKCSLLIGYALGKAQRLLENLPEGPGPVYVHGAIYQVQEAFRAHGLDLRPYPWLTREVKKDELRKALVVAPPNAIGSVWSRRLEPLSLGIASGWMNLRGARRRRAADRGFVLSDHADWQGLNTAIRATGAEQVFVTHGYTDVFSRWLNEQGIRSGIVETRFEGELGEINEQQGGQEPMEKEWEEA